MDWLQYDVGEGPCLDAIWKHCEASTVGALQLARGERDRCVEHAVLFVEQDTLGALKLYSRRANAFLRALAIDRREPPGRRLDRLDAVLSHLQIGQTGTCV